MKYKAILTKNVLFAVIFSGLASITKAADLEQEMRLLAESIREGNWEVMRQNATTLRSNGVDLGTEILYFEGRAALEEQILEVAEQKLVSYTSSTKRVAYRSKANQYLDEIRKRRADEAAAAAAEIALADAQKRWVDNSRIGRVIAIDIDWGFVTLEILDSELIREPIALVTEDSIREFGPLKLIGEGKYTATMTSGLRDITINAEIHACCRPSAETDNTQR